MRLLLLEPPPPRRRIDVDVASSTDERSPCRDGRQARRVRDRRPQREADSDYPRSAALRTSRWTERGWTARHPPEGRRRRGAQPLITKPLNPQG